MPSVFITQVVPLLGVFLSTIQYSSSIFTVLECRKKQDLGSLNPIPIAVNLINSIAWVIYGCVLKNPYLIASVTGGCISSLFSLSTSFYILGKHNQGDIMEKVERILLSGLILWIVVAFILGTIATDDSTITIAGMIACITTICYYYSPLSTIRMVIQTKDSSSLHFPMLLMNMIGSTVWTIYGIFGIYDPFLYIPCGLGVLFTTILLFAKLWYRNQKSISLSNTNELVSPSSSSSLSVESPLHQNSSSSPQGLSFQSFQTKFNFLHLSSGEILPSFHLQPEQTFGTKLEDTDDDPEINSIEIH